MLAMSLMPFCACAHYFVDAAVLPKALCDNSACRDGWSCLVASYVRAYISQIM